MSTKGVQSLANVVINRLYDEKFPNTLTEVVYQRNAFSVVNNGMINKVEPNEKVEVALIKSIYNQNSDNSLYFLNVDLCYDQGYGHNAELMLNNFDFVKEIDNVTFLK